jgi:hypothetical protein
MIEIGRATRFDSTVVFQLTDDEITHDKTGATGSLVLDLGRRC